MKTINRLLIAVLARALAVACGGGGGGTKVPRSPAASGDGPTTATGEAVNEGRAERSSTPRSTRSSRTTRRTTGTTRAAATSPRCSTTRGVAAGASSPRRRSTRASRTSAATNDKKRRRTSRRRSQDDPKFHHARAQLALYQYKADSNMDAAIGALQQAVLDAQFQNVPALVNLAHVPDAARRRAPGGSDCKDDMECAKKNLQRALAIDDAYMPAFNQLALYYFQLAKKRAGTVSTRRARAAVSRDERGDRQARRRAAARARGARLLAGDPEEPELRADPQHRGSHPERARSGQRRGRRVRRTRRSSIRRSSKRR